MGKIRLTLSCWDYDRTRALQDGRVEVEGADLTYLPLRVEETFWRMLRYGEFDVAEMSTGSFLMSRDKGAPGRKPSFDIALAAKSGRSIISGDCPAKPAMRWLSSRMVIASGPPSS